MQSNSIVKLTLFIFLLFGAKTSYSQIISNMSFEGPQKENVPPQGWEPCNQFSTPDTQPGFWEVRKAASDGNTFLGLVTRGNLGPFANNNEAVQTQLLTSLKRGKASDFTLDLSFSKRWGHTIDFGSDFLRYDTPAKLRIYGGTTSCEKLEMLWESPSINHTEWKTYPITLMPRISDISYLILEANYMKDSTYFGNILIDNFVECSIDLQIASDTLICEHEPFILDVSIPNGSYLWQDGSTDPILTITTAGIYSVEVSNQCTSQYYEINVETRNCLCDTAVPIAVTPSTALICENDSVIIDVTTPGGFYTWENGSMEPRRVINMKGVYSVEVSNGCETEFFEFDIDLNECNCELTAPNVFTPNGDGVNETFEINGTSDIARYNLKIFNRNGKMVFQSDDLNKSWDGTFNGSKVSTGVYFWAADIMCIQGNLIVDDSFKGYVTVSR